MTGHDAALARGDEVKHLLYFGNQLDLRFDSCNGLGHVKIGAINQMIRFVKRIDGLRSEASPPQSDDIESLEDQRFLSAQRVRRHIFDGPEASADHRVLANVDKLMNGGHAANDDVVSNVYVSPQRGTVRHNDEITNAAVVCHVRVSHEEAIAADDGPAGLDGCAIQCDTFADHGVVANFDSGWFPVVFQVLGGAADDSAGKNFAVLPQPAAICDMSVGADPRPFADGDIVFDDGEWTDRDIFAEMRLRANDGVWINLDTNELIVVF